jgi:hypothetical protein
VPAATTRRVVVGIAVAAGRARASGTVELAVDAHDRGAQLLVDTVVLERALLDVRDRAHEQQAARRQREDGREQPRPQRGHHVRGWRSA